MNPEPPDDKFSNAALFPELTEAQRLGFHTESRLDLGATYPEAVAMLNRLRADTDSCVDHEGYDWHIVHSQLDDERQRLAWVEWRYRERGNYEDHGYFLKARGTDGRLRVWEIETVNPYFGCTVQSLTWEGDDVVLVYADKHATWEARLGPDGPARRQAAVTTEVACQLTPADIQAVHEALYRPAWGASHWGRHERWRRVLAAMVLLTFVMLLVKLFARNKLGADIVGWDTVAGAMLGGAALGAWWARQNTTVPPADSPVYRPFTLSIDASGFGLRREGFDSHTAWDQVTTLREAGGCLLLATRQDGTHFLPRSAFARSDEADAFFARVTVLREAVVNPPSRMPLNRLRYHLTRDDVRAFFALKREPAGWRGALFYLLLLPALFLLGLLLEGLDDTAWLIGLAAGLGAVWLLTRIVLLIDRRRAIARYPLSEGEIELQRWGDHLRVIADGRTAHTGYDQLGNVVATPDRVFLMTAPDDAIIVPRRAFADADAMAAFAAEVDDASNNSLP
jgi:hypothetical protein